jgi:hypothetical protein
MQRFVFSTLGSRMPPKFKVGDQVERISSIVPESRIAVVKRVIPNKDGYDIFTEYEIEFTDRQVAIFYETQLHPVKGSPPAKD